MENWLQFLLSSINGIKLLFVLKYIPFSPRSKSNIQLRIKLVYKNTKKEVASKREEGYYIL